MAKVSSPIQDFQLETEVLQDRTVHFYHDPRIQPTGRRREGWRTKKIVKGGPTKVYMEECVEGPYVTSLRAVKRISTGHKNSTIKPYLPELEIMAETSNQKYEHIFVKFFGWYEQPGKLYIVLEHFEFGDLQDYLDKFRKIPENEAQNIVSQILQGTYYLHLKGFAHRDLRPQNIHVKSKPPDRWWVKIGDFGISNRADQTLGEGSAARKGDTCYIAPEVYEALSTGNTDAHCNQQAADMWSIGEITFRILTGQPSFENADGLLRYTHYGVFPTAIMNEHNISSPAQSFIRSVMSPFPTKRLSVYQALSHEWLLSGLGLGATCTTIDEEITEHCALEQSEKPSKALVTVSASLSVITDKTTHAHGVKSSSTPLVKLLVGEAIICSIGFSPDGYTLAVLVKKIIDGSDGVVQWWDTQAGRMVHETECTGLVMADQPPGTPFQSPGRRYPATIATFSPDLRTIACAQYLQDGRWSIHLWDSSTGELIIAFEKHTSSINSIVFSPDGRKLATSQHCDPQDHLNKSSMICLWHVTTMKLACELKGHRGNVKALVFSNDGSIVAGGQASYDEHASDQDLWQHSVHLWNAASGDSISVVNNFDFMISQLAFVPDGRAFIALGGGLYECLCELRNVADGKLEQRFDGKEESDSKSGSFVGLNLSPDGRVLTIVTSESSGAFSQHREYVIYSWNLATGKRILEFKNQSKYRPGRAILSPDGRTFVVIEQWEDSTPGMNSPVMGSIQIHRYR